MTESEEDRTGAVVEAVRRAARPITSYDADLRPTELAALVRVVGGATVVGVGGTTRVARELQAVEFRLLRALVADAGFRTLALELDWTRGLRLDHYLRTGEGDPEELLTADRAFVRTTELLDVIAWMRARNLQHPDDPLRIVGASISSVHPSSIDVVVDHVRRTAPDLVEELITHYAAPGERSAGRWTPVDHARAALHLVEQAPGASTYVTDHARAVLDACEFEVMQGVGYLEEALADNIIRWHDRTGHKIVYWGGSAHTVSGAERVVVSPFHRPLQDSNAGHRLRRRFGRHGYASVGLTFDHGTLQFPVPPAPPELTEHVLGQVGLDAFYLDLAELRADPAASRWLDRPARLRLMGPRYDPRHDTAHHMTGGSLAEWFDVVVHVQFVQAVHPFRP